MFIGSDIKNMLKQSSSFNKDPDNSVSLLFKGYTHDDGKVVLRCSRYLLAGGSGLLYGRVEVVHIRCDCPLVHCGQTFGG